MNNKYKKGNNTHKTTIERGNLMEKKQKINCTVESCKYNDNEHKECDLEAIIVTPVKNVNTSQPDESQCASYKNRT